MPRTELNSVPRSNVLWSLLLFSISMKKITSNPVAKADHGQSSFTPPCPAPSISPCCPCPATTTSSVPLKFLLSPAPSPQSPPPWPQSRSSSSLPEHWTRSLHFHSCPPLLHSDHSSVPFIKCRENESFLCSEPFGALRVASKCYCMARKNL